MLYNFALENVITKVQVNQDGLKLNVTHQFIVHSDDFNIVGRSVHTIKKSTEALVVTSKGNGLEVNVDKCSYTVMSPDQETGRS